MSRKYLIAALLMLSGALLGTLVGLWLRPDAPPQPPPAQPSPAATATPRSYDPFELLPSLEQPLNILVMGSDITYGPHGQPQARLDGNTDTMMLFRLDPAERAVWALSIPRDTRTPIPGHGTFKINAANSYGGPALAVQTVRQLLDVPVDRYVRLNTLAIIQLVDAIGGVDIDVPRRMDYDDFAAHLFIHLAQGPHHMSGLMAHNYVRFRHDDLADIGRIQRQQDFLRVVAKKMFRPAMLLRLPQLLAVARRNLDTDLTSAEILRIAGWAHGLTQADLHMVMLAGEAGDLHGVSYWFAAPARVAKVLERLRGSAPPDPYGALAPPARLAVSVWDGVGGDREIQALMTRLRANGYQARYQGLARGVGLEIPVQKTRIIVQTGDLEAADALQQTLGIGEVVPLSTGDPSSDLTLVTGQDWLALRLQEDADRGGIRG